MYNPKNHLHPDMQDEKEFTSNRSANWYYETEKPEKGTKKIPPRSLKNRHSEFTKTKKIIVDKIAQDYFQEKYTDEQFEEFKVPVSIKIKPRLNKRPGLKRLPTIY